MDHQDRHEGEQPVPPPTQDPADAPAPTGRKRSALLAGLLAAACTSADTGSRPPARAAGVETSAAASLPDVRAALLSLAERDQSARKVMVEAMRSMTPQPDGSLVFEGPNADAMRNVQAIDEESTTYLRELLSDHGWPSISMVGKDGARAAWLLAQHADAAPELQADVLAAMAPMVAAGEAMPDLFAYLTDRVRLAKGEAQIYGTQFADQGDGVDRPLPIADPARVDALREEVGLPPLSQYAAELAEAYGTEVSHELFHSGPGGGPGGG